MKVCIHQPNLLPWIGFWNKVVLTDCCVLLLDAQYSRGDFTNRVRIQDQWLTLPVIGAKCDTAIKECLTDVRELRKAAKTIRQLLCTRRQPYRDRLQGIVKYLETENDNRLAVVNVRLLELVAEALGFVFNWRIAPSMEGANKTERLESTLRNLPGKIEYYSGSGGYGYLNKLCWTRGPVYIQRVFEDVSKESVLQLIATHEEPLGVIRGAALWEQL